MKTLVGQAAVEVGMHVEQSVDTKLEKEMMKVIQSKMLKLKEFVHDMKCEVEELNADVHLLCGA